MSPPQLIYLCVEWLMKIAEKNDTLADVITHSKVDNCWSKDEGIGEMQKTGAVPVQ